MLKISESLPIGMKFVIVKGATSSHAVAGRPYWNTPPNSSKNLHPGLKVPTLTCDFNACFTYMRANPLQLVQADVV
jgi:hypothetical protein